MNSPRLGLVLLLSSRLDTYLGDTCCSGNSELQCSGQLFLFFGNCSVCSCWNNKFFMSLDWRSHCNLFIEQNDNKVRTECIQKLNISNTCKTFSLLDKIHFLFVLTVSRRHLHKIFNSLFTHLMISFNYYIYLLIVIFIMF